MADTELRGALERLHATQKQLAVSTGSDRDSVLGKAAGLLQERSADIFRENRRDIEQAVADGIPQPLIKRLKFDQDKLDSVIAGIQQVISLSDPVNSVLEARELDTDLILKRVSCPIGVIGMIFESRPDALVQIASLCLKSANGLVLKGGSEARYTNRILADIFRQAAEVTAVKTIRPDWIYLMETREEVNALLAFDDLIDLIIPRGSNAFVRYIMEHTQIPVLGHADGICHSYIHADADVDMAVAVTVDAKCQYPAVCNALETLLVHSAAAETFLPQLAVRLKEEGVEIRGDERCRALIDCRAAGENDWSAEYLDLILSIRIVDSMDEAVDHIHRYGSGHTDSIVTASPAVAEEFMNVVDSADVMWNCSTRFADGFRYGLGAEVGISTLKIHARGPVGLQGLMSYKWKLYGNGQCVSAYSGNGPEVRTFTHRDLPLT